jgi:hypothetical protein
MCSGYGITQYGVSVAENVGLPFASVPYEGTVAETDAEHVPRDDGAGANHLASAS